MGRTPIPNPWGLTTREAEVFDAMVRLGCCKLVARELRRSVSTVEQHCYNAGTKFNERMPLLRYLAWDRWRRSTRGMETPPTAEPSSGTPPFPLAVPRG